MRSREEIEAECHADYLNPQGIEECREKIKLELLLDSRELLEKIAGKERKIKITKKSNPHRWRIR